MNTVLASFPFEVRAAVDSAELWIYGDIGESWWAEESITAKSVVDKLAGLGSLPVVARINSFGGSVADGLAIHNALKRHPAGVTVKIDGIAASCASLIAMAGQEIEAADNAMLMVHAPWGMSIGNAVDHRQAADVLDKFAEAMLTAYEPRAGEVARAWLTDGQDHWFTASEALDAGLVDKTTDALPIAAAFLKQAFARFPQYAAPTPNSVPDPLPARGAFASTRRARIQYLNLAALGRHR